jgi:hypothetical protein
MTAEPTQPKTPARPSGRRPAERPWIWSIGIYAGKSPLRLAAAAGVANPVLSARDVLDVPATFVADPFMLQAGGLWHMFFEVMNRQSGMGEIGLATSRNGLAWQYHKIVLAEPFHLSYPYVFRWNDDFYMVPETLGASAVRLYRAVSFPDAWICVKEMFPGTHADPSIFRFADRWWMFTCPAPYQHDTLCLYSAADLSSTWTEHPMSPLITGNQRIARPGGRVLLHDAKLIDHNKLLHSGKLLDGGKLVDEGKLINRGKLLHDAKLVHENKRADGSNLLHESGLLRFTQDCYPTYGKQVRAFAITELTATTYKEHEVAESPILSPHGSGWNASGMHHVDAHQLSDGSWLACVDGLINF